jgi:hypothetical protein
MQRVILVFGFLSLGLTAATLAQSVQKDTAPPAWLPKETVKKDTASRSKDLKSFVSGLDPVVGASVTRRIRVSLRVSPPCSEKPFLTWD